MPAADLDTARATWAVLCGWAAQAHSTATLPETTVDGCTPTGSCDTGRKL